jgi:hypothetical protein
MRIPYFGLRIPLSGTAARDDTTSGLLLIQGRTNFVRSWFVGFAISTACLVSSATIPVYAAHVLITEEEAKLPPPKGAVATDRRGVTRGPKVRYIDESEPLHSPTHLQVTFESFGGAKIDPDSVRVTYLKTPNVDLTPRIKPFVQNAGIDMPDVELPVGDHLVRVDVKDSDGRTGSTSFVLKVAP